MPIESKNSMKNKILVCVENTGAFSKENAKKKELQQIRYPICVVKKKLVDAFRQEAKEKKWLYATLMNEISRQRYRKEPTNNEDD